ncbi:Hypothetical protein D9617_2g057700 [Elsinoe fawcettii]|nr:Hypothetical protein D9617_2g057700 [Elsinoe fawcettii]
MVKTVYAIALVALALGINAMPNPSINKRLVDPGTMSVGADEDNIYWKRDDGPKGGESSNEGLPKESNVIGGGTSIEDMDPETRAAKAKECRETMATGWAGKGSPCGGYSPWSPTNPGGYGAPAPGTQLTAFRRH